MFSFLNRKTGPPDAAAVMKRLTIFKYISAKTLVTPPPQYLEPVMKTWTEEDKKRFREETRKQFAETVQHLQTSGLWKEMNQDERKFMQAGVTEANAQMLIDASWLAESMTCLFWALNGIATLPPYDQQADPQILEPMLKEPIETRLASASLRSSSEIQKQRDLAELWHWRARTRQLQESSRMPAQIGGKFTIAEVIQMSSAKAAENGAFPAPIGNDFPAFGKAYRDISSEEFASAISIAVERHRAFNWLCGYAPQNRWAETPTDT